MEKAINVAFGNQESVDVKYVAVSAAVGSATNAGSTAVKNAISKGAVPKMKEVVSKEQKAFSESARKSRLYDCTKDSPDISTVKKKFINIERHSRESFKGQKEWVKFEKNTKRTITDGIFNGAGNDFSNRLSNSIQE